MKANLLITVILPVLFCCNSPAPGAARNTLPYRQSRGNQSDQPRQSNQSTQSDQHRQSNQPGNPYASISEIPVPAGYRRIPTAHHPFADWLRKIPLKKDRTVYLFNGRPKENQNAQFAVLDISVGHQDLQQCADAIMRLRSEFLYARKDFINIDFYTEQGTRLNFLDWANGQRVKLAGNQLIKYNLRSGGPIRENRACFTNYLETVFSYCGTHTLERQLLPTRFEEMQIGDVLIRGGSPGHAMLVLDMAEDVKGHKIYMLSQGYMPAQDIHIVKNPSDPAKGPWFSLEEKGPINTPEYIFNVNELRRWPN